MYAYEKLMQENDLKITDLPADAKIGIKTIQQIENAIRMTEKRGQSVSQSVKDKIKANDKWVTSEILAYLDDEENDDDIPHTAPEVIAEIKEEDPELSPEQKLGYEIDRELAKLFESGRTKVNIEEIRSVAPKLCKHIFETYDDDEENGVKTTNFSFVESEEKLMFNLEKN
jgi:hypothetical protein